MGQWSRRTNLAGTTGITLHNVLGLRTNLCSVGFSDVLSKAEPL